MITLRKIVKSYSGKSPGGGNAVDGLDLAIRQGEFVALLGPSGCGKTTTLMMLAGLLKPTSGEIYFGDRLVNHVEPKDRNIGMVFQSYALYPHLSVQDNIAFPLRERKMAKEAIKQRVLDTSKILQIDHLLDRKPSQLSGGQQQRVAMARALSKDPQILLLDEPMSNLDARLKLDVRDEIRNIQRKLGVTTIIVTHDQEEAMAISDRIAILNGGKIQQYAPPDELFLYPANLFVASFLGNPPMNLIDGTLEQEQGQLTFVSDCKTQVLRIPPARLQSGKVQMGQRVKLGIRPHDMLLSSAGSSPDTWALRIDLVEHLGSGKLLKALPAEGSSATIRLLAPNEAVATAGQTVHVRLHPDRFHLFEAAGQGRNLLLAHPVEA